ncbi:DUF5819 family protein [Streptosporangium canum]|uniref:DUF5819 family protein n=1 Tax=Streptosporangium canum TaxID=324952 RepID=UPI003790DAB0
MTFLYVAPWNPVYDKGASVVDGYIDPYFGQNWELFAPDPIDYNAHVLVRAKVRDATGWERHTGWTDVTEPEMAKVHGSLFPGRISRLAGGGRQMMTDADVEPSVESAKTENEEATDEEEASDPVFQDQAVRHMRAIATLAARARWGDGVTLVQVRVTDHVYPRFANRRKEGDGEKAYSDFGWWAPVPVTAEAVRLWKDAHR